MRQVTMTEPGKLQYDEVPPPEPAAGQVLLRIRRIGICGSDVHVYHGTHPYTGYPVIQGHEFSATVEAVGEGVRGIAAGDKVTALPQIVCGKCAPCRRGDWHICEHLRVMGFQAPGVAQDLVAMDAERIVPLPAQFTFEQGALVEPAAVAVHAVARGGEVSGRNVLVLGGGPIGNLVAQVAQAQGAKVLVSEVSAHRIQVAKDCGIAAVCDPTDEPLADALGRTFGEEGFGLAFECAGVEATINAAIETIGKGGTIVVVAVFGSRPQVDVGLIQDHELNVLGTLMYQRADYERAIELIGSGKVRTDPLISDHVPFEQYLSAYERIERQRDKVMKVFIDL